MAHDESHDYFSYSPKTAFPQQGRKQSAGRVNVSFSGATLRPPPMSRMSTHCVDHSTTNLAEMLHDNGGAEGLKNLDMDYFKTVVDVFRDRKQHHSPVVFDFMLLHEINIHHLEHLLIAEWDWLTEALSLDPDEGRESLADQASQRLTEIRVLLHHYSVALKDFEEMRKRATLDEQSGTPLGQSSWHEKLLHLPNIPMPQTHPGHGPGTSIRRLSNYIHRIGLSDDDPEKYVKPEIQVGGPADGAQKRKRELFGVASPACRQLAGVEDWARERERREWTEERRREVARKEWWENSSKRFSLAFFAGLAVIGPMVLMTLVPTLRCSLTTTSVATLLFALIVTYFTSITERDIVVVTAGYAAVLVVFVGTQSNS